MDIKRIPMLQNPNATKGLRPLVIKGKDFNKDFFKLKMGENQEIIFQKIQDEKTNNMYLVAVNIVKHKKNGSLKDSFKSHTYPYILQKEQKKWSEKVSSQNERESQNEKPESSYDSRK